MRLFESQTAERSTKMGFCAVLHKSEELTKNS